MGRALSHRRDRQLTSRKVLISPFAIGDPDWTKKVLPVAITKEPMRNSPEDLLVAVGGLRAPGRSVVDQRTPIVDFLIEKGALGHGDQIDQHKLDAAFRAAIRGGRLELVQRIWNTGGTVHPSLSYIDVSWAQNRLARAFP